MDEHNENEQEKPSPEGQEEAIFLLKCLREQLTFMERKVDLLIALSKEKEQKKPAYVEERGHAKPPFRPSYNSDRREGRPERSEGRFESRPSYGSKPAGRPGKPYGAGFAGKKKTFFKNKER